MNTVPQTTASSARRLAQQLLLIALLFALGCGSSAPPPEDLPSVDPIVIDGPVAEALRASRRASDERRAPTPDGFANYLRLCDDIDNIETREAATDEYLRLWSADPGDLFLIHFSLFRGPLMNRPDRIAEILAAPTLADTATAPGLFAAAIHGSDPNDAIRLFRKCLTTDRTLTTTESVWIKTQIAYNLRRLKRFDESLDLLLAMLADARRSGGPMLESELWLRAGNTLRNAERLDEAAHAFSRAIELVEPSPYDYKRSRCRYLLGGLYCRRGETDKGLRLLGGAYAIAERRGFTHSSIIITNRLSGLYIDLGEIAQAREYDLLGARFAEASRDTVGCLRACLNVADDNVRLGDMDAAWNALRRAKAWGESYSDPAIAWAAYTEEADYHLIRGDYRAADSLSALAQRTNPSLAGDPREEDEAVRLLRIVQRAREMGRVESALSVLDRLAGRIDSILVVTPGMDYRLDAAIEMAALRTETGEFDLAHEHLERAETRLRAAPSAPKAVRYHRAKGILFSESGAPDAALEELRLALEQALATGNIHTIVRQRLLLANQLIDSGEPAEAEALLESVDRHLDANASYRSRQMKLLLTGRMHAARGDARRAADVLRTTLDTAGKTLSRDLEISLRIELGRNLGRLGRTRQATEQFERAERLLAEAHAGTRSAETRLLLGDSIRDCYVGWIAALRAHPGALASRELAEETLRLRLNLLALQLGRPPAAETPELPRLALVTLLTDDACLLWVARDGEISLLAATAQDVIGDDARSLHHCLDNPARPWNGNAARRLAEHLLSPLREIWPAGEPLFVVTDARLRGLPWSALPWRDGQVLDHAPVIEYEPTAAAGGSRETERQALLAVGVNGRAAWGLPVLDYAETEAARICDMWPHDARRLIGEDARRFAATAADRPWRVIHLACHAIMKQGVSERSYLVLPGDDGRCERLFCRDVADLSLDAGLVFLSCCQTSAGAISDRDTGLDLARALLVAGAAHVVSTSHRVSDEAAYEFTRRFYGHLLAGDAIWEAMDKSRRELRDEVPGREHPAFWSIWQLRTIRPDSLRNR